MVSFKDKFQALLEWERQKIHFQIKLLQIGIKVVNTFFICYNITLFNFIKLKFFKNILGRPDTVENNGTGRPLTTNYMSNNIANLQSK